MAVSSSSGKAKFFRETFDVTTGLTIPPVAAKDTVSLEFSTTISDQISAWDNPTDTNIYVLLTISFEGTTIYTNTQYDWTDNSGLAPTDPDLIIAVDESSGLEETTTIQNYIAMSTDSNGDVQSGSYIVTAKFVYEDSSPTQGYDATAEVAFPTADFTFEVKEPILGEWYDTETPKLQITDSQVYTITSTTAERDVEFVLSPPENRAQVTTTLDNIQKVTYTDFWTGGNEMRYTIYLEYEFTDYIVANVQQAYLPFIVYYVSRCTLYECLEDQYQVWKNATCGTKNEQVAWDKLLEATALSQLIFNGLGCNSDELSALIEDFKNALDCDCDNCLDSTPRQLGSASVVTSDEIQTVSTDSATTSIDLSAGSTIFLTLGVGGGTTEIQVTNIEENKNYRFILLRGFATQTATFESGTFTDASGDVASITPTLDNRGIVDFFATDSSTLTLVSRNDL